MEKLNRDVETIVLSNDDASCSLEKIDEVCKKYGGGWRKLGESIPLETSLLDNIQDQNNDDVDRCRKVFHYWKNQSPTPITLAMVEQHIKNMKADDEISVAPIQYSNEEVDSQCVIKEGVTLEDLSESQVQELRAFLDPDNGYVIKNWLDIGVKIFKGDEENIRNVKALKLHYCGGGSPAKEFLDRVSISYPDTTIKKLRDIAIDCRRNDIAKTFIDQKLIGEKNYNLNDEFDSLDDEIKDELKSYLDTNARIGQNWRNFAEKFGYTRKEMNEMETALKSQDSYSPTFKLIDLIQSAKPRYTLIKFRDVCIKCRRKDVANYLNEIMEKWVDFEA